jgi:RNA polymerase sigma-70 factor (ECF subfamily)
MSVPKRRALHAVDEPAPASSPPSVAPPSEATSGVRPVTKFDGATDEQLVAYANAGAPWARETIFRRYASYVAGVVFRIVRSRGDAEDIVQDTFLAALDQLPSLRDGGALKVWLAQIAINLVRRRFRRRRLLRILGLDRPVEETTWDALAAEGVSPEARAELAAIDRVLLTLPTEERIAWILRHVEGMGCEEVAQACSCSLATANRRIAAVQARLRLHVTLNDGGGS